jgi:hypothetical protein
MFVENDPLGSIDETDDLKSTFAEIIKENLKKRNRNEKQEIEEVSEVRASFVNMHGP